MVSQVYIAALIATFGILLLVVVFARVLGFEKVERKYWLFIALALPLSPIVNVLIKAPLYNMLLLSSGAVGDTAKLTLTVIILTLLLVGFTEEAMKITPLLARNIWRLCRQRRLYSLIVGWCLGVGFGISEAWYIAYGVSLSPEIGGYPFYMYSGYIVERVAVAFIHGGMTMIAVYGAHWGLKGLTLTYIVSALIHGSVDTLAVAYQRGIVSASTVSLATQMMSITFILGSAYFIYRAHYWDTQEILRKQPMPS